MTSIFQKFNENPRLKRGLKTASKGNPDARYSGDDGEVLITLRRHSSIEKDGKDMAILEYAIAPGESNEGEKLVQVYVFADNSAFTAEETMARFFGDLQLLGVETEGVDPKVVEKNLDAVIVNKTTFKASVTKAKTEYPKVMILEQLSTGNTPSDPPDSTTNEEEWEEELSEPETLEGRTCHFQDDECVVDSHNVTKDLVDLANPDDLDEVWYEKIPVKDIELSE